MPEISRRLTAILAADVAGYSRLAGADEEGTVARLRALRQELIDPVVAVNRGRVVKTAGDGILIEFASVVDAARAAIDVQRRMAIRNADFIAEKRIEFRIGIHLGDVMVEADGDLMGDGVNIAARLEAIAEPGGICLSDDAYRQVRDRLAEHFADLGERQLKNIARPVRVYSISPHPASVPEAEATASGPPRLSIVVLPFANIGGDPEQEYFVDGVTESLTTDLSRVSGSFVIARNTAFTYKGKQVDVKLIGRELNVRYVLEGSVQRGGNRMRVNVQLIDADTGNHLWAERFDKPVADLFDMQDEIVARLAGMLNAQLIAAEARRAEQSPDPDSMDLYFQGQAWANKGLAPENIARARGFFERALARDPANVAALTGMAYVDLTVAGVFYSPDRTARLAAAEAAATRALALAPDYALAHLNLGLTLIWTNRTAQGIAECEQALALDRNLADAHGRIAAAELYLGRGEEAEARVNEAFRLSPRDRNGYVWCSVVGSAKFLLGRVEEAVAWYSRAIETNRNVPIPHFWLAAALAQLGRLNEARAEAQAGMALDPTFAIARFRAGVPSDNPAYLAYRERVYEGLRQAGVPEG